MTITGNNYLLGKVINSFNQQIVSLLFHSTVNYRAIMSVRKKDHYIANRILLSLIGQWPHQSPLPKFLLSSNVILALGSQMYLQTCGLIASWTDWDLVIECLTPLLLDTLCLMKFFNCIFNARKMGILLERMQNTWNIILSDKQMEILQKYTHMSYKLTSMYAVTMYIATVAYVSLPHVPAIIALVSNKNETIQRALLFRVEAVVDTEKYYYIILIHSIYSSFILITLPAAVDTMFFVYVNHACGMFSLIGYQLENVQDGNNLDVNIYLPTSEDKTYKEIIDSIIKHKDTLRFAELLNSAYSMNFLFQTGLIVVVITFYGVEAVIFSDHTEEVLRFGLTGFGVCSHFLFLNFPGQMLHDHSLRVNDSIYYSNWYAISIKSRQLLDLMLMRSRIPTQITAGKICTMSLENYSSVMRATMSYFTMLSSLR